MITEKRSTMVSECCFSTLWIGTGQTGLIAYKMVAPVEEESLLQCPWALS